MAVHGHEDRQRWLITAVTGLREDLARRARLACVAGAFHGGKPDRIGSHVVPERSTVVMVERLDQQRHHVFVSRAGRPDTRIPLHNRRQLRLQCLQPSRSDAYREPDGLDAGVPLVYTETPHEGAKLIAGQIVAGGEKRRSGAQQLDVGVEANINQLLRLVHGGAEAQDVSGVVGANDKCWTRMVQAPSRLPRRFFGKFEQNGSVVESPAAPNVTTWSMNPARRLTAGIS
jgi:hypothetical protein